MRRRDFLKATGLGAAAAAAACSPDPVKRLPMLVRDPAVVAGKEEWKASLCGGCGAGCGVVARVVTPGRAVKLEGNPAHPISAGRLCARGLTALESLYHPDRLGSALARRGDRRTGGLAPIESTGATAAVAARLAEIAARNPAGIAVIAGRVRGTDRAILDAMLVALGAGPAIASDRSGDAAWREAVRRMTGHEIAPWPDLAHAGMVLAFGVEVVGGGPSPVAYARGLVELRERGAGPGRLVVVASRYSATAAQADEWVVCAPGSEGLVALGIARELVDRGLHDRSFVAERTSGFEAHPDAAGEPRPGFGDLLRQYPLSKVEAMSGVPAAVVARLAREAAERRPALAIGGGLPAAHSNGLGAMMSVLALDALLGSFGEGGLRLAAPPAFAALGPAPESAPAAGCPVSFAERLASGKPSPVEALLVVGGANPVYEQPALRASIEKVPLLVAVTSLVDETTALADWVLPEAHPLERWVDDVPEPMGERPAATIASPVVKPWGEARALGDHLLALARGMGGRVAAALPWPDAEAALRARWAPIVGEGGLDVVASTGVWVGETAPATFRTPHGKFDFSPPSPEAALVGQQSVMGGMESVASETLPHFRPPAWAGDENSYPLVLEVIERPGTSAGPEAARAGLAELRDPWTGACWESWAELHPQTAALAGLGPGDAVVVTTACGAETFPLRVVPWLAPGAVAVTVGGGPRALGRFSRGRGGHALALAATGRVEGAGARAWASTRARVSRAGRA